MEVAVEHCHGHHSDAVLLLSIAKKIVSKMKNNE